MDRLEKLCIRSVRLQERLWDTEREIETALGVNDLPGLAELIKDYAVIGCADSREMVKEVQELSK